MTALTLAMPALAFAERSVTVAAGSAAGDLPMDGEGTASTHVVKIADLTLSTDAANGLTVFITSGNLTNAGGHTPVAFQVLLVSDGASAPPSSSFTTASGTSYTLPTSTAGTVEKDLYIKYHPASLQDPGMYSAQVDISVVDN
jgi:hypothetical protein